MRKTFPLDVPGLKPPRVVESIKNEIRKYLKRERGKALPTGADYWDFDCKFGRDAADCAGTHSGDLNANIDKASQENWAALYIEILAKPVQRTAKKQPAEDD
jgi:hypothetical protein